MWHLKPTCVRNNNKMLAFRFDVQWGIISISWQQNQRFNALQHNHNILPNCLYIWHLVCNFIKHNSNSWKKCSKLFGKEKHNCRIHHPTNSVRALKSPEGKAAVLLHWYAGSYEASNSINKHHVFPNKYNLFVSKWCANETTSLTAMVFFLV